MPCTSGSNFEEIAVNRDHLDIITRLACDRCRWLEGSGLEIPHEAIQWWRRHKELDRARIEKEEREKRLAEIRKKAAEKLTKEEREALGL